jgi:hypothetical protein
LIERVLAADVSYTISRMRVLERIPGNPIGIGYRRIDDGAVALVSLFLPAFRRVVGLRPGHEGEIEPLLAWYREYGVKPTFEIVPGMFNAELGRELARHGFLPSGFHASLIGEPHRTAAANADIDIDIEQVVSESAMEQYLDAYVAGWGLSEKDHAQYYVADRVAYLADAATAPAFRGRGLHVALLRRRIREANAADVDFVFSGAEPMGTSHRNMERAGLRLHFLRTKWTAA